MTCRSLHGFERPRGLFQPALPAQPKRNPQTPRCRAALAEPLRPSHIPLARTPQVAASAIEQRLRRAREPRRALALSARGRDQHEGGDGNCHLSNTVEFCRQAKTFDQTRAGPVESSFSSAMTPHLNCR